MAGQPPPPPPVLPFASQQSSNIITIDDEQDGDSRSSSSNSPTRADYEESDFYAANNDSQSSIGGVTPAETPVVARPHSPASGLPAEILIEIFKKLSNPQDLLSCMLTCKRWAKNAVDTLWWRPACSGWDRHGLICRTLNLEHPYFTYSQMVRRLNLTALAPTVNDGSVTPLRVCTRVERLTLTACTGLTDVGLMALLQDNKDLLALDISGARTISQASIEVLASKCKKLQGLNITDCKNISNDGLIKVAENCTKIKRLKLNGCDQVTNEAVMAFAKSCPNILEIDLHMCKKVTDEPITAVMKYGQCLRELRLSGVELLTDHAFLNLPSDRMFEHLRILDFTSCIQLTDMAIKKIISVAPRLRNLVLAKCRNLTDEAVFSICTLGKNLHYLHLGHCGLITDESVKAVVRHCGRIRYIDLGCCTRLTDESVKQLAQLPKLRRIGLVKCSHITDASVYALAHVQPISHRIVAPDGSEIIAPHVYRSQQSSLERVHLSYCTQLNLPSIITLLNNCPRLTHLSLTGVDAFLRTDLRKFCREAPAEFNNHQRNVFCVFSGEGVKGLRHYLNQEQRRIAQGGVPRNPDDDGEDVLEAAVEDDDDETMMGMMAGTNIDEAGADGGAPVLDNAAHPAMMYLPMGALVTTDPNGQRTVHLPGAPNGIELGAFVATHGLSQMSHGVLHGVSQTGGPPQPGAASQIDVDDFELVSNSQTPTNPQS